MSSTEGNIKPTLLQQLSWTIPEKVTTDSCHKGVTEKRSSGLEVHNPVRLRRIHTQDLYVEHVQPSF